MSLHSPLLDTDELGDDHTAFPPPTRAARLQNVILASSPGYTPPAARPITPKTLLVRSATTSPAAAAIPQAVPVHRVTHSPSRHHLYPSGSPIFPLAPLAAPVPAWNAMGLARSRGGSAAGLAGSSSNTMVASVPSRPIYLSSTPPPATFAELRLAQMNASPKHIMSRQHQIAKQARGDGKTPRGSDDESDSDDLGPTPPNGHRTISITSASTVSTLPTRTVALTSISAAEVPSPKEELRSIWRLGWPVAMALLFRIAMSVTDVAVLGHKDTDFLAAAASALIWTNVTSAFLYRAYGSALSTLCSQSYGAGNFQLVGYWLQQGLVFSTVSSLFVAVLWWFTADVLRLIAIDSDIAALGGTFARWSILWLLPQIWMECLQRYFQSIHVIFPALVLNAVFVVVNAGLNLLLIFGLPSGWFPSFLSSSIHSDGWSGLGFIGSPIATAISRWLMLICFWVYTCVYKRYHAQTWGEGWNLTRTAAMHPQRVRQYLLQQCLPSAIGVCLEEFNLQIVAIFATHLGADQIATHNATLEIFFFLTAPMFGLITAVQVRIGLYLGNGQAAAAKQVGIIGLKISLGIGSVIGVMFVLLRSVIGKIYSDDPAIWELAEKISVLVGAAYLLLAFFYTAMGVLNGQGRPLVVAVSFLVGCWLVCLPLAYAFAFPLHQGLLGIWYAFCCGYGVVTVIVAWKSYTSDWEQCAVDARERSESKKMAQQAVQAEAQTKGEGEEGQANGGTATKRRRKKTSTHSKFLSSSSRVRSHSLNSSSSTHASSSIATAATALDSPSIAVSHASTRLLDDADAEASEEDEVDTTVSSEEGEEEAWNAEEVAYREEMLRKQRMQMKASTAPVLPSPLLASVTADPAVASHQVGSVPITPVANDLANISDADPMAAVAQPLAMVAALTIGAVQ